MSKRIHEVLLVSSPYDLYLMEEEGLLADRISDEFALFHLTHIPSITRVSSAADAIEAVRTKEFDLVITGMRVGRDFKAFDLVRSLREMKKNLPVVLITSEKWRLEDLKKRREESGIDKLFYWHGDTRLFLAIIKSFEDMFNAPHDCLKEHVRTIILVEDSPHFYSAYLPIIYTEILDQVRSLIAEGTSDEEKLLRMQSRPKILMAGTYEEAAALFERYKANVLGVISDIRFPREGKLDPDAGFIFTELVKNAKPDVPVLLQSQDTAGAWRAGELGASFADKNSPHLLHNLREFILAYFGFGDFVFRMPSGREVGRAHTLKEMEDLLAHVPVESIEYHSKHNHFSNWFFARGEFGLAEKLRPMGVSDFESIEDIRRLLRDGLKTTRLAKRKTRILNFTDESFDSQAPFIRFGEGSIGGKGRGIAFMSRLISESAAARKLEGMRVAIPQTAAIGTDVFDHFIDHNHLYRLIPDTADDANIAKIFLEGKINPKIVDGLVSFLKRVSEPLAVRSSSLSEDSLSQPFAGLYTTYFIPNNASSFKDRLAALQSAIKLVYASMFFVDPKSYMEANGIAIEGEKMAVLIQQVVGRAHGDHYYPDLAGVAQSYNFFPVGYQKPEDCVAEIVAGLGTMAVQGGISLRFSPKYPGILPQFAKAKDMLTRSQREFHALDLKTGAKPLSIDESSTIATLPIDELEKCGLLAKMGGVYSPEDDIVYEGMNRTGPRVLTFKRVLSDPSFPLPAIISEMLNIGSHGMGCAVEIEFAANLGSADEPAKFVFLQLRPLVSAEAADDVDLGAIKREEVIAMTQKAMGNGVLDGMRDIVYVKRGSFDISRTAEIAAEIGRVNSQFVSGGGYYMLFGFGRWGTLNSQLGIPVAYAQVSHARVICEISTTELNVEPSQGTHFFHNIASARIGYFSIDATGTEDIVDFEWLDKQPAVFETNFVRHVRLDGPAIARIDGRNGRGVILKPVSCVIASPKGEAIS